MTQQRGPFMRCVTALILMLIGWVPVQAGEDGLGELRLFFSTSQRQGEVDAAEAGAPSRQNSGSETTRADPTMQPRSGVLPAPAPDYRAVPARITFSALVQGNRLTQVLLNGLPCSPIPAVRMDDARQPVPLSCPIALRKGQQLRYMVSLKQVQVLNKGRVIARLSVGQGS